MNRIAKRRTESKKVNEDGTTEVKERTALDAIEENNDLDKLYPVEEEKEEDFDPDKPKKKGKDTSTTFE